MRRLSQVVSFPFYPIFLSVYPVLFLWSVNVGQILPNILVRSLLISIGLGLVFFLACFALLRNLRRAALASAWFIVILFTYGHFYALIEDISVAGFYIGRHRYFLLFLALLTPLVIILVARVRKDLRNITILINLIVLAMVVLAAVPIIDYEIRYGSRVFTEKKRGAVADILAPDGAPDVYYIILDGYARSDVLAETFQYNNQKFIDALKEMEFYIPECAYSNYTTTIPSLSSAMNMEYLEDLGIREEALTQLFDPSLAPLMIGNKVQQEFARMGYKIAAFHGYTPALDLRDADYYFNVEIQHKRANLLAMRNFERMYLRTTLFRPLVEVYEANEHGLDFLPDFMLDILYSRTDYGPYILTDIQWRDESEFSFSVLPTIPQLPGKKFVYAHFYTTHKPYVFNRDGGFLPQSLREDDYEGYINTVEYASTRMLEILEKLIQESPVKPIIILQADHGTGVLTGVPHNKILNAYYFPDQDYSRLYSTITPVNTFRVVLNQFFHQNYPLLPDILLVKDVSTDGSSTIRRMPSACDLR